MKKEEENCIFLSHSEKLHDLETCMTWALEMTIVAGKSSEKEKYNISLTG